MVYQCLSLPFPVIICYTCYFVYGLHTVNRIFWDKLLQAPTVDSPGLSPVPCAERYGSQPFAGRRGRVCATA